VIADRHTPPAALPDARWALTLPIERVPAALAALAALQGALAARLLEQGNGSVNVSAPSNLVDVPTLAAHLGVHQSLVRTAARAGRIPSVRVGRYVRFRVSDVERALAESSL
jgi:excisionase family DNA binding protein